jgi:hypothetical protein
MTTRALPSLSPHREPTGVLALGLVLGVVALKWALTFAVAGRYGWHDLRCAHSDPPAYAESAWLGG